MIKVEVKYILKPDQRDAFLGAIIAQGIDRASKNENGNICYDFEVPNEKDVLYLHELWANQNALSSHAEQEHYKALAELKAKYVEETIIEKEEVKE